jgi:hypothetical protein
MRPLLIALALSAATPAAAQIPGNPGYDYLRAQQEAAQRAAVARQNELMALEANLRAQQAINDLEFRRAVPVQAPQLPYPQSVGGGPTSIDLSKLPSIPDAALAASNKRVQEIARPTARR